MKKNQEIIVTGIAENAKNGAILVDESSDKIYYIDNLDFWENKYLYKKLIVRGELQITNREKNNDIKKRQEVYGVILTIKNAKWKFE